MMIQEAMENFVFPGKMWTKLTNEKIYELFLCAGQFYVKLHQTLSRISKVLEEKGQKALFVCLHYYHLDV